MARTYRKALYNGTGEAEVVLGSQLSQVLREWCIKWLADRDREIKFRDDGRLDLLTRYEIGPVQVLTDRVQLIGAEIHIRRVSGIINGEFEYVPLSQADEILTAIERPDLLGDEVKVIANPNWSLEKWLGYMAERGCA